MLGLGSLSFISPWLLLGAGGAADAVVAAAPDAADAAPGELPGHPPALRSGPAGRDALSHAALADPDAPAAGGPGHPGIRRAAAECPWRAPGQARPDAGGGRRLGRRPGLARPRALHGRGGGRGRALQDSRHPAHDRAFARRRGHRRQRHAERGRGAPEDPGAGAPPLGDGPHRGPGGGAASRSEAGDRRPCRRGLALRRARRRRCRFRPQAGRRSAPAGLARRPLRSRDPPSHLAAPAGSRMPRG